MSLAISCSKSEHGKSDDPIQPSFRAKTSYRVVLRYISGQRMLCHTSGTTDSCSWNVALPDQWLMTCGDETIVETKRHWFDMPGTALRDETCRYITIYNTLKPSTSTIIHPISLATI